MIRRFIPTLMTLSILVSLTGCLGSSAESIRKEAQSNADKYIELIKANDFEGAYTKSMHEEYKRQLPLETFVKYRQGIAQTAGPLVSYQMVHYEADPGRQSVTLHYAVKYANMPENGSEIVKLRREGTEWRITSVEPKLTSKPPPSAPTAPPSNSGGTTPK